MKLTTAVITALLFAIVYYLGLIAINRIYKLNEDNKDPLIKDKVCLALLVVGIISSGIIAYFRFESMSLPVTIFTMVLMIFMPLLSVLDIKKQLIPNKILLIVLGIWILIIGVFAIVNFSKLIPVLTSSLTGAIVAGATFMLCYILSKHQVGAGDVKLVFIMGLYMTGDRIIGAILYGSIICCIYSVVQMIRKKLTLKSGIPMVPFLYLGTIVTFFIL